MRRAEGGAPINLTAANRGMDTTPAVSPDGRWLAYTAMARPGYEADRQVVQLRNLATGETRALTADWDRSVGSIAWARGRPQPLVTAGDTLDTPVFRVDVRTGRVTRLTQAGTVGNVGAVARRRCPVHAEQRCRRPTISSGLIAPARRCR